MAPRSLDDAFWQTVTWLIIVVSIFLALYLVFQLRELWKQRKSPLVSCRKPLVIALFVCVIIFRLVFLLPCSLACLAGWSCYLTPGDSRPWTKVKQSQLNHRRWMAILWNDLSLSFCQSAILVRTLSLFFDFKFSQLRLNVIWKQFIRPMPRSQLSLVRYYLFYSKPLFTSILAVIAFAAKIAVLWVLPHYMFTLSNHGSSDSESNSTTDAVTVGVDDDEYDSSGSGGGGGSRSSSDDGHSHGGISGGGGGGKRSMLSYHYAYQLNSETDEVSGSLNSSDDNMYEWRLRVHNAVFMGMCVCLALSLCLTMGSVNPSSDAMLIRDESWRVIIGNVALVTSLCILCVENSSQRHSNHIFLMFWLCTVELWLFYNSLICTKWIIHQQNQLSLDLSRLVASSTSIGSGVFSVNTGHGSNNPGMPNDHFSGRSDQSKQSAFQRMTSKSMSSLATPKSQHTRNLSGSTSRMFFRSRSRERGSAAENGPDASPAGAGPNVYRMRSHSQGTSNYHGFAGPPRGPGMSNAGGIGSPGNNTSQMKKISLSKILTIQEGFEAFTQFLLGEISCENLLFLIEVSQMKARLQRDRQTCDSVHYYYSRRQQRRRKHHLSTASNLSRMASEATKRGGNDSNRPSGVLSAVVSGGGGSSSNVGLSPVTESREKHTPISDDSNQEHSTMDMNGEVETKQKTIKKPGTLKKSRTMADILHMKGQSSLGVFASGHSKHATSDSTGSFGLAGRSSMNGIGSLVSTNESLRRKKRMSAMKRISLNSDAILTYPWLPIALEWHYLSPFRHGLYIYEKYIGNMSRFCINIDFETRRRISMFFRACNMLRNYSNFYDLYHIFDTAWLEVWNLLHTDTFKRFMLTPAYARIYEILYQRGKLNIEFDEEMNVAHSGHSRNSTYHGSNRRSSGNGGSVYNYANRHSHSQHHRRRYTYDAGYAEGGGRRSSAAGTIGGGGTAAAFAYEGRYSHSRQHRYGFSAGDMSDYYYYHHRHGGSTASEGKKRRRSGRGSSPLRFYGSDSTGVSGTRTKHSESDIIMAAAHHASTNDRGRKHARNLSASGDGSTLMSMLYPHHSFEGGTTSGMRLTHHSSRGSVGSRGGYYPESSPDLDTISVMYRKKNVNLASLPQDSSVIRKRTSLSASRSLGSALLMVHESKHDEMAAGGSSGDSYSRGNSPRTFGIYKFTRG